MKKYLTLLLTIVFATLAMGLSSCDKDDEPSEGVTSNIKNYNFIVNGKTYYYGIDLSLIFGIKEIDLNTVARHSENGLTSLSVVGWNNPIKEYDLVDWVENYQKNDISNVAYLSLYLVNFDYTTMKEGTRLSLKECTPSQVAKITLADLEEIKDGKEETRTFYRWPSNEDVQGYITFVSLKDNLLTIKLENVSIPSEEDNTTFNLSGTIVFDTEGFSVLP